MTRNYFYTIATAIIAMMITVNANAQGHHGNREMSFHNGQVHMNNNRHNDMNHGYGPEGRHNGMNHGYGPEGHHNMNHGYGPASHHNGAPAIAYHHPPRIDRYGYVPGWEGRVMYRDGRWGYLRGNDWYWYNRYFEPDYYYAHPVAHFHTHHIPVAAKVAGAVAGAVVLGSIISALAH